MAKNVIFARKFSGRLRQLVEESGGMQEAATKVGISYHDLDSMVRRESIPQADRIDKICRGLGCSPAWLISGEGPMVPEVRAQAEGIPVLATASAANGRVHAVSDGVERYDRLFRFPANVHMVLVSGDSMSPTALDGQQVFVLREDPEDGGLAVIEKKNGEVLFKRVYFDRKEDWRKVQCQSVNQDPKYRPITLKRSEVRHIYKIKGTWV